MEEWKKELLGIAGYSFVGSVLAALTLPINWLGRHAAQSAVKVRPMLAEVGWIDALLANHLGDWMYYHYPTKMSWAVTLITFCLPFTHLVWFKIKTKHFDYNPRPY